MKARKEEVITVTLTNKEAARLASALEEAHSFCEGSLLDGNLDEAMNLAELIKEELEK